MTTAQIEQLNTAQLAEEIARLENAKSLIDLDIYYLKLRLMELENPEFSEFRKKAEASGRKIVLFTWR